MKSSPPGRLDAKLIRVHKRAPVPYKPFPVVDPKTGKAVKPDTLLTLPHGKKIKAGEYYAQLNQLEKKFNALGYSLRGAGKRVLLQDSKVSKSRLDAQAKKIAAKHRHFDAQAMKAPPRLNAVAAAHRAALKRAPSRAALAAARDAGAKTDHELQTVNFVQGDNNTASAYLTGQLEASASLSAVDVKGEAHAGVYLVKNKIEVLTATAALHAGDGSDGTAQFTVSVLGQSVYNVNDPVKTTWKKDDQKSCTVDQSVPFTFTIAGIPVSVKVGARGSVGASYSMNVSALPPRATAQVVPTTQVDAYAQAGLDAKVAEAGAEVKLQLIHLTLTFHAEVGVEGDKGGTDLHLLVHGEDDITLLAGNLSFYIRVLAWRYDHAFFSWDGFKKQGVLFNVERRTPVPKAAAKDAAPPAKAPAKKPGKPR
jgi:hypothetical protein